MNFKEITIPTRTSADDTMGALSVFESSKEFPFDIKRFYYVHGVKEGVRRGFHAHKNLWQMLFCPYGSIRVDMDDGKEKAMVMLDSPSKALLMGPGVWHTMDWMCDNAVLCVAASDYYNEDDYMRDYSDFLNYMKENPDLQ